jgi:hypothetical protein
MQIIWFISIWIPCSLSKTTSNLSNICKVSKFFMCTSPVVGKWASHSKDTIVVQLLLCAITIHFKHLELQCTRHGEYFMHWKPKYYSFLKVFWWMCTTIIFNNLHFMCRPKIHVGSWFCFPFQTTIEVLVSITVLFPLDPTTV